jgi:hypothetical protein
MKEIKIKYIYINKYFAKIDFKKIFNLYINTYFKNINLVMNNIKFL